MSRIYLDACVIIYLMEGSQPFQSKARARVAELRRQPHPLILTSLLSRMECRVRPLRNEEANLLALYEAFFGQSDISSLAITGAVIEKATELRARYGFKTPDAIHLATAMVEGADLFLTGDEALSRCAELTVEVLRC